MNQALFSSKTDQWATPQDFFDELDREFHFDLDPCADEQNHKAEMYFTKEDDGLSKDWSGHRVFCNPPYGRAIGKWVEKSFREGTKDDTLVVMLIHPAPFGNQVRSGQIKVRGGYYGRTVPFNGRHIQGRRDVKG